MCHKNPGSIDRLGEAQPVKCFVYSSDLFLTTSHYNLFPRGVKWRSRRRNEHLENLFPINLTHDSLHCPKLPCCQLPRSCHRPKYFLQIFHLPNIFFWYILYFREIVCVEWWRWAPSRCLVLCPLGAIWQPLLEINPPKKLKINPVQKK